MIYKSQLKKKIIYNFSSNKKIKICDIDNCYDLNYLKEYYNKLKNNHKIVNLNKKKVLAVINNKCSSFFWINFIISFLLNFTLMPNEKGNDSYKKIKKYYDAIIIFDGIKFKIINNKIRIKNSVFNKIDYISSTSGSTGKPKMILHDINSIIKNSRETIKKIKYKKNKNFLIAIPNYFNSAVCHFFTCLINDMSFFSSETLLFPKDLGSLINKFKINYFGGAPLQTSWILGLKTKMKSLEKIISSGDFLDKKIILEFHKLKLKKYDLYNIYGITELGGRVFINHINKSKKPLCVGDKLSHFKIYLKKVSKQIYELCVNSKFIFKGYYEKNLNTKILVNQNFQTNDLVKIDGKNIFIVGRKNEIFKSSGKKIFPEKIKNEILKVKNITNVFVFPKYVTNYGNVPIAAYQAKKRIKEDKIYNLISKNLENNHIPKELKWYKKFPYLGNKKINKIKIKNESSKN